MAKKAAAAKTKETDHDPEVAKAEDELAGILQSLDNFGAQLVEAQWRAMSEAENDVAIGWAASKRAGSNPPLPQCLIPFASPELKAEQEKYQQTQQENRLTILPVQFLKPAVSKKDENGKRKIKVVVNIPATAARGGELDRLFRWKQCRIEFSERSIDQWNPLPGTADELQRGKPVRTVVANVSGYNATRHASRVTWLIDETSSFSKDDAYDLEECHGSIRIEVLGDAQTASSEDSGDSENDGEGTSEAPKPKEPKKPAKPKKEAPAAKPPSKTIPGTTPEELADTYSVALTDRYRTDITIISLPEGKVSCRWDGEGPAGPCAQGEPSVRTSEKEAAIASIGNAVDYWNAYPEDEAKEIVIDLKYWLGELEKGKTAKLIEAEIEEEPEDEDDSDD